MENNNYQNKRGSTFSRWLISMSCVALCLFASTNANAQFSVTTNGGSGLAATYPDLASAITALNAATITSPVVITCPTGTETSPAGGYNITAQGTSTNTITITGNGAANSIITAPNPAGTAGALNDAIFKLTGADWVTITGFAMNENGANTTTAAGTNNMVEWGVALLYATTTNGSQNNTIENNTITLNRTYQNTFGIYANATHSATAVSTSATATTTAGGNSGLKIYGNTVTNVNNGIIVVGPTAVADQNTGIDIGGTGGAQANTISNYGTTGTFSSYANVSGTVNGILVRNSIGFNVSYNSITSSSAGTTVGTLNGIQVPASSTAPTSTFTNNINNNTISLRHGLTSGTINGITYPSGSASTTSTLNCNANDFNTFSHPASGSGSITFITISSTNLNTSISNNTFTNLTPNTTGSVTFISNSITVPAGGSQTINSNSINTTFNKTGAGGTVTGITSGGSSTTGTFSWSNNNFSNITVTGATSITIINNTDGGSVNHNISNNTINNIVGGTSSIVGINSSFGGANGGTANLVSGNTITNISSAGAITGITIGSSGTSTTVTGNTIGGFASTGASAVQGITSSAPTTGTFTKNKIYDLSSNNASGTINGIAVNAGALHTISNNLIGDLRATAANAANPVVGINVAGGTTVALYYNTVYLAGTSSGALFGSSALSASTTPTLDSRNNIFINNCTPVGATGFASAFRRSTTTLTSYASTSNNNLYYAGTPGTNNLIFFDGTNSDQTLSAFQTRVSTRDNNSKTENCSFASLTGTSSTFLHFAAAASTLAESGGATVAGITDDFDGNTRNASTPDIGADEFSGTSPAPALSALSITPSGNSCTAVSRAISVDATTPSGTITGVVLNYSFNGTAQTPIAMTNTSGNTWMGTIPAATPTNAVVTWSVTATNSVPLSVSLTGASYQDDVLLGISATASANPSTVCAGSTTILTATPPSPVTVAFGAGGTTSSSTAASFLPGSWGGAKTQYIIRASELAAAGIGAGNITSIGYEPTTSGQTYQGFTVSLNTTASTSMTTSFLPVGTQVYRGTGTDDAITPTANVVNTLAFGTGAGSSTSFFWNGTSNIVVTFNWSSIPTASTSTSSTMKVDATGFTCSAYDQQDAVSPATLLASATADGTGTSRPRFTFGATGTTAITTYSWSDGASTVGSTNPLSVSPSTNTTYTVTASTSAGCTISATVAVSVVALPSAPTATNSTQCGPHVPTASVTSTSGAGTPSFNWYAASTGGSPLQSGTSATYSTSINTTTTFYVTEVSGACESSPRTEVIVTVTTPPSVSISGSSTICSGSSTTLTASSSNDPNYTYSWTGGPSNSATYSVSPLTATTYTVSALDGSGCNTTATFAVAVNPVPSAASIAPATSIICGTGSQALTASGGTIIASSVQTIGTGTGSSTASTTSSGLGPNPLQSYYGGAKQQMLWTAAELASFGIVNGSVITSVAFNLNNAETGRTLLDFTVGMSNTATTAFASTTFEAGASLVRNAASVTVATGWNTLVLDAPFTYTGGSLLVETSFSNVDGGGSGTSTALLSTTSFASTLFYRVDNAAASSVLAATTASFAAYSTRNNVQFGVTNVTLPTWSWSPNTADVTAAVSVSPSSTTVYTATATIGGCSASATATVNVKVGAAVSVSGSNDLCDGVTNTLTATVTGTGTNYQWYESNVAIGGANAATLVVTAPGSYSVSADDDGCNATSSAFVVAYTTNTITASAGANGTISPSGAISVNCGQSQSFTITPDAGYQILDVLVDGSSVGAVGTYSFTNVTAAHTIAASFLLIPCANPATANAGSNATICGGTYTLGGSIGGGASSATWSTSGDGTFDSNIFGTGTTYTPGTADIAAGTVTITLTTDDPDGAGTCVAAVSSLTLTVGTVPTVSLASDCSVLLGGNSATLTTTASAGPATITTYAYTLNGTTSVGPNAATYSTATAGSYTVTVTSSVGCSATSSAVVIAASGPLSGTYTIGGSGCSNYATFAAAVADLNTKGVAGNVTINVAAGYTETVPAGGLTLKQCALAVGLQSGPTQTVTFVKSGAGANPKLTANTGTTSANTFTDNIVKVVGMDNVTFDGIDLSENAANTTATTLMEAGLGVYKCDGANGSNNVTYTNGVITLNRANGAAIGVRVANTTDLASTTLTYSGTAGSVSAAQAFMNRVSISNNTITNTNGAALFNASTASTGATISLNDTLNNFSGNTVTTFGGNASALTVVSFNDNRGLTCSNNNFNSVAATTTGSLTIINGGSGPHGSINGNTISVSPANTTAAFIGITWGSSGTGNTASISNNTVQNCSLTSATTAGFTGITSGLAGTNAVTTMTGNTVTGNTLAGTGSFIGIANTASPLTLTVSNNTVTNNTKSSTGTMTLYSAGGTAVGGNATYNSNNISGNVVAGGAVASTINCMVTGGSGAYTMNGNTINNNTITALSAGIGTITGYSNAASATSETITNNTISNLTVGGASTSTHVIRGIVSNTLSSTARTVSGNTIFNLATLQAASSGTITGITSSNAATANYFNNKVYDLNGGGSATVVTGMLITTGTTVNVYNNLIGNLTSTGANTANAIIGISATGGTNINLSFNTIRLAGTTSGGSSGISATATPTTVTLRNNIVYNGLNAGGTGLAVGFRRAAAALTQIGSATNNNLYYTGATATTPVYYDGTTAQATLTDYKSVAGLAPREANSVFENVSTFASTTGSSAQFLHFTAGASTLAESGGIAIAGITTDFDADTRATTPDIGADEFAGTAIQPAISSVSASPAGTQCVATARTITVVVVPGASAVTGVNLSYSYNGGAPTTVAMTGGPLTWTETIPAATPANATVTYSVVATDGTYNAVASGVSYADEPLTGVTLAATASPSSICAGTSSTLTAAGVASGSASLGAGASTSSSLGTTMFPGSWGGAKTQYLIRASELTAAGLSAGNITAIAFEATTSGQAYPGFAMSIGNTANTVMTNSFQTGLVDYYNSASFTPTVGVNTLTLSTPFFWNGTSNIIIGFCWSTALTTSSSSTIKMDAASFTCNFGWQQDSQSPATICGTNGTPVGGSASTPNANRPKFTITGNRAPATTFAWSDGTSSIGTGSPLVVTPSATTIYTATATDVNGCTLTATATVTVNPLPSTPTVVLNSTQCGTGVPLAEVSGTGGGFRWYTASTGGSPLVGESGATLTAYSISSTTTFYVSEFDGFCESARAMVIANVTTPPTVAATSSVVTNTCPFTDFSLSATSSNDPNYAYVWTAFPVAGSGIPTSVSGATPTIQATAGGSYTYTVTATDISPIPTGCVTTATTVVSVSNPPAIQSISASPSTVCSGEATVLNVYSSGLAAGPQVDPAPYTHGAVTNPTTDEEIYNVTVNGSSTNALYANTAGCTTVAPGAGSVLGSYSNFASLGALTTLTGGNTYSFTIEENECDGATFFSNGIGVWIDYNRDGDFADAGETLYQQPATVQSPNTVTQSFTVPATAAGGLTRMRVIAYEGGSGATLTPTANPGYGEIEDHAINIIGVVAQDPAKTYSWSPVGGTAATATVNPTSTTTYTVSVNETGNACTNYEFVTVTVNPLPATLTAVPSVQCGPGVPPCSVTGGGGGIIRWYLTPTGGSPIAGETGLSLTTYSISAPTTFYVAEFDGTCEGVRVAVFADEFEAGAVTLTSSTPACLGSSITLTANDVTGYGYINYTLSCGTAGSGLVSPQTGAIGSNPESFTVTPTAAGTYTYTYLATDGTCSASGSVTVVVGTIPSINAVTASTTSVCSGGDVVLNANTISGGPQVLPSGYPTVGTSTNNADEQIFGVTFGSTVNNQTETCTTNYTDYSGTIAPETVGIGDVVSFEIRENECDQGTLYSNGFSIFIDYNRDGDFADAGEQAYTTTALAAPTGPSPAGDNVRTGTITIPMTATAGLTKMRVVLAENVISPTFNQGFTYGEAEDYAVNILAINAGTYDWSWSPSGGTGATVTVNPTTTGAYTVTATDPASGCTATAVTPVITVNPLPSAPTLVNNSTQCGTGIPTCEVLGSGGGLNWYLAPTGGVALPGETGATLTAYSISTTTTFYVAEFDGLCESTRTMVIADVTPAPTVSISASSPSCQNSPITLTLTDGAGFFTGTNYSLNGSVGGGIASPISGTWNSTTETVSVTPTGSGSITYTLTSTGGGCSSVVSTTVTVTAAPVILSATASPTGSVCAGSTVTLTGLTGDYAPGTVNTGTTGTGSIGGNEGNPYRSGNGTGNQIRTQILVLASELTAAGMAPGPITSLAFTTTAASSGTVSNLTIDLGHTSATALTTTFETSSVTSVFSQASFTPAPTGLNVHTFSTPFSWNGTSNLLINVCQTNSITGTATVETETVAFNATTHKSGSTTGCTDATGSSSLTTRPKMQFGAQTGSQGPGTLTWVWNPGAMSGNVAVINPTTVGINTYTVTATDPASGCSSTASVTVDVLAVPAAPTGTPSVQCGIGVPLASVVGTGGSFQWYLVPVGGSPIAGEIGSSLSAYSISTTTTFYVAEFDGTCPGERAEVIATVTTPDVVTAASSLSTVCGNAPITLTATNTGTTNTYTYSWSSTSGSGITGSVAGNPVTVTPTAGGTYTYVVTATDATAGCVTSASVAVTVTAPPVITTATATPSTVCLGTSTTLAATALVGSTGTITVGTQTTTSITGGPYRSGLCADYKTQYLYTVADLTAAGLVAGQQISSIGFNVTSVGSGAMPNWKISIGNTSATSLTTAYDAGATTTVYGPTTVTVGTTGVNTYPFAAPFTWNGTSNIIVQVCHDNTCSGSTTIAMEAITGYNTYDNGVLGACAGSATGVVNTLRPVTTFGYSSIDITSTYGWVWNPGSLSGSTVSVTPTSTGTQTYTVTATDPATGCTSSASVTVDVINTPPTPIITTSTSSLCGPGSATLTVTNATPGAVYQWQSSSTGLSGSYTDILGAVGATYVASVTAPTFYQATVTCGSSTDVSNAVFVDVVSPSITTINGATRCGTGSVTVSVVGNGSFDWFANSSGGAALATNTDTYTTTVTGTTTFWVQAYIGTCLDPAGRQPVSVTVNPAPAVTITNSGSNTICSGTTITLTASSSNDPNYTYGWSTDGTTILATTAAYTITPMVTTTYFVGAIDNTTGTFATCQAVASQTIVVNTSPTVNPTADVTSICNTGTTVNLNANASGVSAATFINATFNTGADGFTATQTSSSPTLIFTNVVTSTYTTGATIDGTPFFEANSDAGGSGSSTSTILESPTVNTAGYSSGLTLDWDEAYNYYSAGSDDVHTDVWDGTSWVAVYTAPAADDGDYGTPVHHSVNIGAYANAAMKVRFVYSSNWGFYNGIDNVNLSGTSSIPAVLWTASPSDPSLTGQTTIQTPAVTPTATTTYTVVATSSNGCTASGSVTVTYSPLTPPTITASSTTVCGGSPTTLDAGAPYDTYSWSDGTSVVGTSQTLTVSPTATTTYTVTVTNGACSATATQTINVYTVTPASVTSSATLPICAPNTTTLCVSPSTGWTSVVWNTTETTTCITAASSANYSVTVTDANGCVQTASLNVVINPAPPTAVATASGPTNLCWDGVTVASVILNADTTDADAGASIVWNDILGTATDALYIDNNELTFSVNAVSSYGFNFTVTNAYGCSATSNTITVSTDLAPAITTLSATNGCPGDVITITGSNFTAASAVNFNGVPSTYTVVDDFTITATVPTAFGSGSITVFSSTGTCSASASFDVRCGAPMVVNAKAFLQGYYLGGSTMNPAVLYQGVPTATGVEADTVQVEIYDETTFALAGLAKGMLMIDGSLSLQVYGFDGNYYIAIRHRSSVLTWSAAPVALSSTTPSTIYDFTTAASQNFASWAADDYSEGIYSIFSGDINQDEYVDANDYPFFDIDNSLGACCSYLTTDLNGDGFVDANDYPFFNINNDNGVFSIHP